MASPETCKKKNYDGLISGACLLEEILIQIFCYLDRMSLLNCQLVCKHWKNIIQCYVWRKKAILRAGQLLPKDIPWVGYYHLYKKCPINRNLIKNHSGELGVKKHWQIVTEGGRRWSVENPPIGVPPLPIEQERVFEGKQSCFVTSFFNCTKKQVIDLQDEGLIPYILDTLQPPIVVSEWYSCRWDCPATYICVVELLGEDDSVIDVFDFRDSIEGEKQFVWHHVSYEFKNYGPGVRKVLFRHAGYDNLFWDGHYGSKMAGACICVKIPKVSLCESDNTQHIA